MNVDNRLLGCRGGGAGAATIIRIAPKDANGARWTIVRDTIILDHKWQRIVDCHHSEWLPC